MLDHSCFDMWRGIVCLRILVISDIVAIKYNWHCGDITVAASTLRALSIGIYSTNIADRQLKYILALTCSHWESLMLKNE